MKRILICETSDLSLVQSKFKTLAQSSELDPITIKAGIEAISTIYDSVISLNSMGQHVNLEKQVGSIKIIGKLRKDFSLFEKLFFRS